MSKIEDKSRAIQEFGDNFLQLIQDNVRNHEGYFCDSVRDTLYQYGIDGKGNSLGEYAPSTIQKKINKGQPYDRVTLRDEGDFYDGMHLKIDEEGFEVESGDWKAGTLANRYGDDITTISKQAIDEYVQHELLPSLQDELKYRLT